MLLVAMVGLLAVFGMRYSVLPRIFFPAGWSKSRQVKHNKFSVPSCCCHRNPVTSLILSVFYRPTILCSNFKNANPFRFRSHFSIIFLLCPHCLVPLYCHPTFQ
ncbi:TPA: hypothetical protein GDO54_018601 [Pyxicephalus adspersus]|uniref:Secreted protein n=1 Tax=Pyxicephalus adspersus TaxID=30357 RepID=A0AAV2ZFC2_PYXAD|nr:TPA: hypothetical protein GDO54_018601 [Pyxicephalus adspersus]